MSTLLPPLLTTPLSPPLLLLNHHFLPCLFAVAVHCGPIPEGHLGVVSAPAPVSVSVLLLLIIVIVAFRFVFLLLLLFLCCFPLLPFYFLLFGWLEVFFADSLVRVVVAASRFVEDGLLDLLVAGDINRQPT
jgi:hypothetical protein